MKKFLLILMLIVCLLFVGCSGNGGNGDETSGDGANGSNGGDSVEHVHTWGEIDVFEEADCVYDGEGERECTECGFREAVIIPKLGHKCESYVFLDNPTFTKAGRRQGACLRCGKNIKEVYPAFEKEYKTVSANLTNVKNVYFNGYWKDGALSGANGAIAEMLGAEAVAKVTGASKVTYTFKLADASKSAVVAYSLDGTSWTRQDLKDNATVAVTVPAEETVVRVMYVSEENTAQAICLTAVSADKGTVVPCVKDGVVALTISDKVDNIEKDALTLASEELGYTSWRVCEAGLGYNNFGAVLTEYISATGKTTITPDYILLDLGANDASASATNFTTAVSYILNTLLELYPEVDVYLVRPMNGAKVGQLESMTTYYGNVSMLDTSEWSVTDASVSAEKLSTFLVDTYGETAYFKGLYDKYNDPDSSIFPDDKKNEIEFGPLFPLT